LKKVIIVGSGAGGATAAKELQGHFDVTVLEKGKAFQPFSWNLRMIERIKKTGLLFDERAIQALFPAMRVRRTEERMILVKGEGLGGTTTLCTGNALRLDHDLKELGIELDEEFAEIYKEVPVTSDHSLKWHKTTTELFAITEEMGLAPKPTPKFGHYSRCLSCGQCVLGCQHGVKWDSRQFLDIAVAKGACIVIGADVKKIVIENGKAVGVQARKNGRLRFYPADLVLLSAGGFATPVILENSKISCEPSLFVDPVLCVATEWEDACQNREIPMPFVIHKEHFILSPYFDHLSFFFNRNWRYPARNILSLMIKMADSNKGEISRNRVKKHLNTQDRKRLDEGVALGTEILCRLGATREKIFLGSLNAGHPGGMLPLTVNEATSFHHDRLPSNLYVADATLLPKALGAPPILTIMALTKRIAKICSNHFS